VRRVDSLHQLRTELPERLRQGPRVLKQYRGHSGFGVWRVEMVEPPGASELYKVRHAQRGSVEELLDLETLLDRMAGYFESGNGGHMIDQAWQPRIVEGMVRAYMVEDRVAGFGHQAVNALHPGVGSSPAPLPGPRLYHGAEDRRFKDLKERLEREWIEVLRE